MSEQKQTMQQLSTYVLVKKETGDKKARFNYQVVNTESGTIVSQRKSNRHYVAATIHGSHYFGRTDLVGKGDHRKYLHNCQLRKEQPQPVAYLQEEQ